MNIVLKTDLLKLAVAKVAKASSNNPILPLTSMIGIKTIQNKLRLSCYDGVNTLTVPVCDYTEEVDITTYTELFSKLVSKLNCPEVTLKVTETSLEVSASHGNYKLPLVTDEEGVVKFPHVELNLDQVEPEVIKVEKFKRAYTINKSSVAKDMSEPHLTGFYFGKFVVTSNRDTICFNKEKLFTEDLLMNANCLNLLSMCDDDEVKVVRDGSQLYFVSNSMILKSSEMESKNDFPIQEILQYMDEEFTCKCTIEKEKLYEVLDRLTLFIDPYDKNSADFSFGEDGITLKSVNGSSVELVKYASKENVTAFDCLVDVPQLKEQIESMSSNVISVYFGNENAIKLEENSVVKVVALLEKDA